MIEKNIYLYGAGTRCHALYSLIKEKYKKIIIIDGNPEKWGSNFEDNKIINSPDVLKRESSPWVVITNLNSKNYDDITSDLHKKYNVENYNILSYEKLCWENLKNNAYVKECDNVNYNNEKSIILDAYGCQSLGGIEEWLVDLAEGLIKKNYNIRIMTDEEKAIVNNLNCDYSDVVHRIGEYDASEYLENYNAVKSYLKKNYHVLL